MIWMLREKKLKDLESLIKLDNQNNDFAAYEDLNDQKAVFEIRKAGLNILMSMKGDRKGVAFIEDCAVTLENLADYTERLRDVFRKRCFNW